MFGFLCKILFKSEKKRVIECGPKEKYNVGSLGVGLALKRHLITGT